MGKLIEIRKEWFYACDGGVNPAHHQPKNCTIIDNDGIFEVWIGSSKFQQRNFGSIKEALGILTSRYDKVFLTSEKFCILNRYPERITVKDEPIKYRNQHYDRPLKQEKPKKKKSFFNFKFSFMRTLFLIFAMALTVSSFAQTEAQPSELQTVIVSELGNINNWTLKDSGTGVEAQLDVVHKSKPLHLMVRHNRFKVIDTKSGTRIKLTDDEYEAITAAFMLYQEKYLAREQQKARENLLKG